MKTISTACAALAAAVAFGVAPASAHNHCVTKYAKATSPTESQAKWFALETTVQAVSWSLWPGYVATSKVDGYSVADKYKCAPDGGQVTCHVAATFCKKK
jgi:hypothetical protein